MSTVSEYETSEGSHSPSSYSNLESPQSSPLQQVPELSSTTASCKNGMYKPKNGTQPFLRIVEQPQQYFRFRYDTEKSGSTHGSILGRSYIENRSKTKTHPTVELVNFSDKAVIKCSIKYDQTVDKNKNVHRNVFRILEAEQKTKSFPVPKSKIYRVGFPGIGVHTIKKADLITLLYNRLSEVARPDTNTTQLRQHCEDISKIINQNVVRLEFSAFDTQGNKICEPLLSEPILNKKCSATNALNICRMNIFSGRPTGGEDLFLLIDKVDKNDIKVRFFELDANGSQVWEAYARFLPSDVHHQCAIVCRTPAYKNPETSSDVKVYIELVRGTYNGTKSEPKEFTYRADYFHKLAKKRKLPTPRTEIQTANFAPLAENLPATPDSHFSAGVLNFEQPVLVLQNESSQMSAEDAASLTYSSTSESEWNIITNSLDLLQNHSVSQAAAEPGPAGHLDGPLLAGQDLDPALERTVTFDEAMSGRAAQAQRSPMWGQSVGSAASPVQAHFVTSLLTPPPSHAEPAADSSLGAELEGVFLKEAYFDTFDIEDFINTELQMVTDSDRMEVEDNGGVEPDKRSGDQHDEDTARNTSHDGTIEPQGPIFSLNVPLELQGPDTSLNGPIEPQGPDTSLNGPIELQGPDTSLNGPIEPQGPDTSLNGPIEPQGPDTSLNGPIEPQGPDTSLNGPIESKTSDASNNECIEPQDLDTSSDRPMAAQGSNTSYNRPIEPQSPMASDGTPDPIVPQSGLEPAGDRTDDVQDKESTRDDSVDVDYPASFTAEDTAEVKQLVLELCNMVRDKRHVGVDDVRARLERLFAIRLSNGDTFLHMALFKNQPSFEALLKLIQSVKVTHLLDYANHRGETILHLGVVYGSPELVERLVTHGCSLAARTSEDETALHYAVRYASAATLRALLDAAAGAPLPLDAGNAERQSALHLCALHGRAACAALLGARGASAGVRDAAGRTPLHLCAYDARVRVLQALLPHARAHVDAEDAGGRTPLAVACARAPEPDALQLARALLAAGARAERAWPAAHPGMRALLRLHLPRHLRHLPDDDVKSEPEDDDDSSDDYESAEEESVDDPSPENLSSQFGQLGL